ncbi:hypothetical protein BC628DRAFT_766339 [Trametes gibbosa]|nr:hypothetical protein BC628DRAFT_766339 [Trametes gibbosa]
MTGQRFGVPARHPDTYVSMIQSRPGGDHFKITVREVGTAQNAAVELPKTASSETHRISRIRGRRRPGPANGERIHRPNGATALHDRAQLTVQRRRSQTAIRWQGMRAWEKDNELGSHNRAALPDGVTHRLTGDTGGAATSNKQAS